MEFKKVKYEKMKLQSDDKVNSSLIGRRLKESSKVSVEINEKQVKKSTKVLSRLNKNLNEDCKNV